MGLPSIRAQNGKDGLSKFFLESPDILFTELVLPDISTPEMIGKIRESPKNPQVPVYLIAESGNRMFENPEMLRKISADGVLKKPVSKLELQKLIAGHFGIGPAKKKRKTKKVLRGKQAKYKGNLYHISYPEILSALASNKETGVLVVESKEIRVWVSMGQGLPVKAKSHGAKKLTLANLLQKKCLIDRTRLKEAKRVMKRKNLPFKEVLISMKIISTEELARSVAYQSEQCLLLPFGWKTGGFSFYGKSKAGRGNSLRGLSVPDIFLKGAKGAITKNEIAKKFAGHMSTPFHVNEDAFGYFENCNFSDKEKSLVVKARDNIDIRGLLELSLCPKEDSLHVIWTLFQLGVYKFREEAGQGKKDCRQRSSKNGQSFRTDLSSLNRNRAKKVPRNNQRQSGKEETDFSNYKECLRKGRPDLAVQALLKANEVDKKNPENYTKLAKTIWMLSAKETQSLSLADSSLNPVKLLQKAIAINPDYLEAHLLLGKLYKENHFFSAALKSFNKVLKIEPEHKEASREASLMNIKLRKLNVSTQGAHAGI